MEHERCKFCDDFTGKAGIEEDSLYVGDYGPLCDQCHTVLQKTRDSLVSLKNDIDSSKLEE